MTRIHLENAKICLAYAGMDIANADSHLNDAENELRKAIGAANTSGQRRVAGLALVALAKVRAI